MRRMSTAWLVLVLWRTTVKPFDTGLVGNSVAADASFTVVPLGFLLVSGGQ